MNIDSIIDSYLSDDETVLWKGSPQHFLLFNCYDWFLVPFTLIFGGVLIAYSIASAYSMLTLTGGSAAVIFPTIGILFLLIGGYIIFGRLWYRNKRRKNDIYVVTNTRIHIINTLRETTHKSFLKNEICLQTYRHSLLFMKKNIPGDLFYNLGLDLFFHAHTEETPGFYGLQNVDDVRKLFT